jgi:hypothetical protein
VQRVSEKRTLFSAPLATPETETSDRSVRSCQMGEFETTCGRAWLATDDRVCICLDRSAGGPKLRHSCSG